MVPVDIVIRLANEGVPVQAIARATGWPFADLHAELQAAQQDGHLIAIPCVDWPAGYSRDEKLLYLTRQMPPPGNRADLQDTIRRVFGLSERPAQILLLLLQHPQVSRERIAQMTGAAAGISNVSSVHVSHLRHKLQRFGLAVQTMYGYGYRMLPEQQRKALDLIFHVA